MKEVKRVPVSERIAVAKLASCALSVVGDEQSFALTSNTTRKKYNFCNTLILYLKL
jgi:hypothetical protein